MAAVRREIEPSPLIGEPVTSGVDALASRASHPAYLNFSRRARNYRPMPRHEGSNIGRSGDEWGGLPASRFRAKPTPLKCHTVRFPTGWTGAVMVLRARDDASLG